MLSRLLEQLPVLSAVVKSLLRTATPFLNWLPESLKIRTLKADIIAGVTTGLVIVPQGMANAQLAGLPPYMGLYASFLPTIIGALFGSSRQLSTGPVAVVALLTAAALEPIIAFNPDAYVVYAIVLAMIVGLFQLGLGLLRLGAIVSFLSHPVVTGFTNAGALIIAVSQLPKLLGIDLPRADHLYEQVWDLATRIPAETHMPSLVTGGIAAAIILLCKAYAPRLPGILVAVAFTTFASWYLDLEAIGVAVIGDIPRGLPDFTVPDLPLGEWLRLLPLAVAISIIGFMESISIAKSMAAQTRQRLDPNQELVGQGLANIASSLSQGCPVSGSFARSAVNFGAGAITGMSSILTGLMVLLTLYVLTTLLYFLPLPVLAAVVITAVVNLFHVTSFVTAWRVHRDDGVVAVLTFTAIMVMAPHLETGLVVGVVASLVLYLVRSMRPKVYDLSRHADGTLRPIELFDLEQCPSINIVRFDGSLYFANASMLEDRVLDNVAMHKDVQFVVLDATAVNEIDYTGVQMLTTLRKRLADLGIELLITGAQRQMVRPLHRVGFLEDPREAPFFAIRARAINYAWSKIDSCPKEGCTQTCALRRHSN